MKLSTSYTELTDIIKTKTGKDITFEYVDTKTVNVKTTLSFQVLGFHTEKQMESMIKILGIDNGELSVQYTAGPFVDKLISIVGKRVPRLNEYVAFKENCVVVVHLNGIEQVRMVLEKMIINDICFNQDGG